MIQQKMKEKAIMMDKVKSNRNIRQFTPEKDREEFGSMVNELREIAFRNKMNLGIGAKVWDAMQKKEKMKSGKKPKTEILTEKK